MIIVTHDPQVAAQAERVIEIRDGEIVRNPPAIEKVNVTGGRNLLSHGVWLAAVCQRFLTRR
ncbi:macrolide export ATP-binding/permease protein [Escherichia coli]|uniref:Macrolide export ATP-binding/permease protein n=1 Tax=Escherichia coli TaxID=562 RepID=A0A377F6D2_ECOLX|nr:macrolide export ATP-binding/permease protein [Escherichia coli]